MAEEEGDDDDDEAEGRLMTVIVSRVWRANGGRRYRRRRSGRGNDDGHERVSGTVNEIAYEGGGRAGE